MLFAAAVLAINAHWWRVPITEGGDFAANSLQVYHAKVFRELLGNYSRWQFHHPGPVYFYLFAAGEYLFYDLLHIVPAPANAQFLTVLLVNTALLFGSIEIFARHFSSALFRPLALGAAVLLIFEVNHAQPGSALVSLWMPHVALFAFLFFASACASVAAGRIGHLPLVALGAMLLVHLHMAQFLFAGVMSLGSLRGFGGGTARFPAARPDHCPERGHRRLIPGADGVGTLPAQTQQPGLSARLSGKVSESEPGDCRRGPLSARFSDLFPGYRRARVCAGFGPRGAGGSQSVGGGVLAALRGGPVHGGGNGRALPEAAFAVYLDRAGGVRGDLRALPLLGEPHHRRDVQLQRILLLRDPPAGSLFDRRDGQQLAGDFPARPGAVAPAGVGGGAALDCGGGRRVPESGPGESGNPKDQRATARAGPLRAAVPARRLADGRRGGQPAGAPPADLLRRPATGASCSATSMSARRPRRHEKW